MKRIALLVTTLLAMAGADAQVYQYKDAAGRMVYSDQPPPGGGGRLVSGDSSSSSTSPTGGTPAQKNLADRDMEFKKRAKTQQEAAAKAEKEAARKEDCLRAQRSLQAFDSGQRISTVDEKGERAFMDDSQRAVEADRARKAVAELCK